MAQANLPKKKGDNFLFNIGESQNVVNFLNKQSNRSLAIRFAIDLFIERYGLTDIATLLPAEYDSFNPSKYTVLIEDSTNNNGKEDIQVSIEKESYPKDLEFDESANDVAIIEKKEPDQNIIKSPNDKELKTTKPISDEQDSNKERTIIQNKTELETKQINTNTEHDDDDDSDVEVPGWL